MRKLFCRSVCILALAIVAAGASPHFIGASGRLAAQELGAPLLDDEEGRIRQRAEWFDQQRTNRLGQIPAAERLRAVAELDAMLEREGKSRASAGAPGTLARIESGRAVNGAGPAWLPIGPQPTSTPYNVTPVSGRVSALAVDPRDPYVVYLGAAMGGVWKTTDGGVNWTPLTDTQPSLAIGSLALDPANPNIVYAGTGEQNFSGDSYYGAGILKSADGGTTWTQYPGPFVGPYAPDGYYGGGARIGALAVKPNNGQVLLAAVQLLWRDGIYRSTDGGVNWTNVLPLDTAGTAVFFDAANPDVAYAALGGVWGSPSNGVYKSTDGGATWNRVPGAGFPTANVGRIALAQASSNPDTLYAGVHNTADGGLLGLYKTTDGGANWVRLANTPSYCERQCWYDNVVVVHPSDANIVFAGGAFGGGTQVLWRSSDGGAMWTNVSRGADGYYLHADMHALAFATTGVLYAGNDGGAYRADDPTPNPVAWVNLNDTLNITQFYPGLSMDPRDPNTAFGGTQDNGTQKYSGSPVWDDVTCGDGGWTALDFTTPTTVYGTCQTIDIEKSTAGGRAGTWSRAQSGIDTRDRVLFIPPLVMDPSNAQTLYFGTYRAYRTTNGATSWTAISGDLTGGQALVTTLAVAPGDPNTVYAGTNNSKVQVTTNALDANPTWTDRSAGLPPRYITQITVDAASSTTAYVTVSGFSGFSGDAQGHVFRTTNGGATWTDISGNLPNIPVNDIVVDPDLPGTLYVATDIGVFSSHDSGTTWSTMVGGLPNVAVLGLKLHRASRTLRAATHGRGMWDLALAAAGPTRRF